MPCQRKDQKQSLFCEKDLGMTNGSVAIIPSAKKKKKEKESRVRGFQKANHVEIKHARVRGNKVLKL